MSRIRESLTIFTGPMFSRKTLMLLDYIGAAEAVGQQVLVVKPNIDNRFAQSEIRSRFGGCHTAVAPPINDPQALVDAFKSNFHDTVALDEVQFFDPSYAEVIKDLFFSGIPVSACGLNRDYRGNAFPIMENLLPLATDAQYLTARCMYPTNGDNIHLCGNPAHMTQRLVNGSPDSYNSPTVIIENPRTEVTYQARCLDHWQVTDMPDRRFPY